MVSGVKTSEFWVAIIAPVIIAGSKLMGIDLDDAAVVSIVTSAVAYILSRAVVKASVV